jgi:hypothetical protein
MSFLLKHIFSKRPPIWKFRLLNFNSSTTELHNFFLEKFHSIYQSFFSCSLTFKPLYKSIFFQIFQNTDCTFLTTVNSLLFVAYQFSWILWIVSNHEIKNKTNICTYIRMHWLYQGINKSFWNVTVEQGYDLDSTCPKMAIKTFM